jgi:hypothetical protein
METEMAAAQLLLVWLCRAQKLRREASSCAARNQEPLLSFKNAWASLRLTGAKWRCWYPAAIPAAGGWA